MKKGSTFTVLLPISHKYEIKASLPDQTNFATAKEVKTTASAKSSLPHLLIVEDNEDLVRFLIISLQSLYQLEVAHNGQEGIKKALELVPDIIITDVMMPEKDGFELCDTLKNHELTSHIPIIMLTARTDVESRLSGLSRGADAYMAKPFLREELQVRLEGLLIQRQKLQAFYLSQAGIGESETMEAASKDDQVYIEDTFIKKVNQYLDANLDDHTFGVEQLSESLNMSASNLFRKIKALTDLNTNHYIRSYRLAKAKVLLKTTDLSVSEIAYQTGFSDPRYFSKAFKNEVGKTPSQYRKGEN